MPAGKRRKSLKQHQRLVSADRRGFWWVKWIVSIEVDDLPHWWQSPFPLQ